MVAGQRSHCTWFLASSSSESEIETESTPKKSGSDSDIQPVTLNKGKSPSTPSGSGISSMDERKKRIMLDISRRYTSEIEAALQDSPGSPESPGKATRLFVLCDELAWCALFSTSLWILT